MVAFEREENKYKPVLFQKAGMFGRLVWKRKNFGT